MSDTENSVDTETVLSVEYKGGQLQVVEVAQFGAHTEEGSSEGTHILSDFSENDQEPRFIIDPEKGLVQLDMLNLTLVRCGNGEDSYRLVAANNDCDEPQELVNCVLQSSDGEDSEQQAYVMVDEDDNSLIMMNSQEESENTKETTKTEVKKILSPVELLEKAKAYQRAKAQLIKCHSEPGRRGRKRKCELPPAHELFASPNFKLYLYSCKLCSFKCNIVKELTEHKALEHGAGSSAGSGSSSRGARGARGAGAHSLQCARCPFRGSLHSQLMKHVQEMHSLESAVTLDTADVLVCGACGFESASRAAFTDHMREHAAS